MTDPHDRPYTFGWHGEVIRRETKNDPAASVFPGMYADRTRWGDCGCVTCVSAVVAASDAPWSMPFIVCPDCGNKRCPRATHHAHACTGSNEPGQAGSRFADVEQAAATGDTFGDYAAPEPSDDAAAMHIDPEPPSVTLREFTDEELAAPDGALTEAEGRESLTITAARGADAMPFSTITVDGVRFVPEGDLAERDRATAERAWDEGRQAGADMGLGIGERIVGTREDWPPTPLNPYRKADQ